MEVDPGRRAAGEAVEATRLVEVVVLGPAADRQLVHAEVGDDVAEHAFALDVVFGRARRHRHAARAGQVRRAPEAHAAVVVVIGLERKRQRVAQRTAGAKGIDPVAAQAGGIVIGIVGRGDLARIGRTRGRVGRHDAGVAVVGTDVGDADGKGVLAGTEVVPIIAQAPDLLEREILVVLLDAVGIAVPALEVDRTGGRDELDVGHQRALLAIALPLVAVLVLQRGKTAHAIGRAHGDAAKPAPCLFRAVGAAGVDGDVVIAQQFGRVDRLELERTTQVAGRLRVDCTRALRHGGNADVLGADRAADVQAVHVAVAHVAQRNAVERETELVLVETADGHAGRPFVVAESVGRLEVDAGQLLNRLERAGARREDREIGGTQFLGLAGLAGAIDHDRLAGVGSGRFGSRSGSLSSRFGSEGGMGGHDGTAGEQDRKTTHEYPSWTSPPL